MKINFNENEYETEAGTTLAAFLAAQKVNTARLMLEYNGEVLDPAAELSGIVLNEGDRINAFSLVAGG